MSMLHLYNTLSRMVEPFVPADPGHVTFYTCGPTVYDDAHIGNFRSFLAADLLRRWIESPLCAVQGPDGSRHTGARRVVHVMNITDVGHMTDDSVADGAGEDKMAQAGRRLLEAKKAGTLPPEVRDVDPADPYAIATYYTGRFCEDARKLGLKVVIDSGDDSTLLPRATANVGGMIRLIERLIDRGHAYVQTGASRTVYFHVPSFGTYGRLSGNTLEALKAGAGGRVEQETQSAKRHPADFLLWKEDPTHVMRWDSPWGEGYPGWHVECSVMAFDRLVSEERRNTASNEPLIDIHSGGEDNIFPHHECELAQSCCAFSADPDSGAFARMWFHPRHLFVNGGKMSKRDGTFRTARSLFEGGYEPGALRYELIKTHFRSNANFTEQGLRDSGRTVERWRRFMDTGAGNGTSGSGDHDDVRSAFADAMNDDLNIAGALGAVNKWIGSVTDPGGADAALLREFDEVVGVLSLERSGQATEIAEYGPGVIPDPEIDALLVERRTARESRDFTTADRIRDEFTDRGLSINDLPDGRVEVRRAGTQ